MKINDPYILKVYDLLTKIYDLGPSILDRKYTIGPLYDWLFRPKIVFFMSMVKLSRQRSLILESHNFIQDHVLHTKIVDFEESISFVNDLCLKYTILNDTNRICPESLRSMSILWQCRELSMIVDFQ